MKYKIEVCFKGEIFEYDAIDYKLEDDFLILNGYGNNLFLILDRVDYFKVIPVHSELDCEYFWTKY